MKKFLNYIQKRCNYTDYQIEVIRYFFLSIGSDVSKLLIILGFSAIIDCFGLCLLSLTTLVFLRTSGGGFHCEHYLTCLLFSFSFTFGSIFLTNNITLNKPIIVLGMIISFIVAYKLVPIVSYHRPEPPEELIKRSRIINFSFLILCAFAVFVFYQNQYCALLFWVCILHTAQLILALLNKKGGKYYVRVFNRSFS